MEAISHALQRCRNKKTAQGPNRHHTSCTKAPLSARTHYTTPLPCRIPEHSSFLLEALLIQSERRSRHCDTTVGFWISPSTASPNRKRLIHIYTGHSPPGPSPNQGMLQARSLLLFPPFHFCQALFGGCFGSGTSRIRRNGRA